MPKRGKVRGYRIGCHPFKTAVNQWLANVTRKVINSEDPWALLLESEATLTIQSLTQQSSLQCSTSMINEQNEDVKYSDQASNNFDPLIKEQHIIIPQPDLDQINKIQNSCPKVKLFPLTSHELLSDISSFEVNTGDKNSDRSSFLIPSQNNPSTSLISAGEPKINVTSTK